MSEETREILIPANEWVEKCKEVTALKNELERVRGIRDYILKIKNKFDINCEEDCYQSDRIIEYQSEFMDECMRIIGAYE